VLWTAGWDGLARRYALRHLDERPEDAVARVASTWHVSLDEVVNLASRPVPADLLNPADR
jgi:hypothetical protein